MNFNQETINKMIRDIKKFGWDYIDYKYNPKTNKTAHSKELYDAYKFLHDNKIKAIPIPKKQVKKQIPNVTQAPNNPPKQEVKKAEPPKNEISKNSKNTKLKWYQNPLIITLIVGFTIWIFNEIGKT